jgi:ABC-type uncharacterized transport system auxiliary subunit
MMTTRLWAVVFGAILTVGCTLVGTTDTPRYYRPMDPSSTRIVAPALGGIPFKWKRVRSASYLGERIAWRSSPVEAGFHESSRWIEAPADLVEHALQRELFGRLGLVPSTTGPALDVELLAFDEVLTPEHDVEIAMTIELTDAQGSCLRREAIRSVKRVQRDDLSSVAVAMGAALDEVTETAGTLVSEGLRK